MTNTTQTTALVLWTSEVRDPARRVARHLELHCSCLRAVDSYRTGLKVGDPGADWMIGIRGFTTLAGAYLERAVEVSR